MVIPEKVREEMRHAGEKAADVGIDHAVKFLSRAKSLVAGVYLMPPFIIDAGDLATLTRAVLDVVASLDQSVR